MRIETPAVLGIAIALATACAAEAAPLSARSVKPGKVAEGAIPEWISFLLAEDLRLMDEPALRSVAGGASFRAIWSYPDRSERLLRLDVDGGGRARATVKYQDHKAVVAARRGDITMTRECSRHVQFDAARVASFADRLRALASVRENTDEVMVGGTLLIAQSATAAGEVTAFRAGLTDPDLESLVAEWEGLAQAAGCRVPAPAW